MNFSEQLTENFYHWENYCRGWFIYENEVQLEPPFTPFKHLSLQQIPFRDDGVVPNIFQRITNLFVKRPIEEPKVLQDLEPFWDDSVTILKSFSISLTQSTSVKSQVTEQLLLMLSLTQNPVSFEIVGDDEKITFQIVCRDVDLLYIQHQIKGYFPSIVFTDTTETIFDDKYTDFPTYFIDFGLSQEVMRPLNMSVSFDPDPLTGIISVLESLQIGEHAIIQIQFSGVANPWALSMMKSVTVNGDESFFSNAPEMVTLTKQKTSSPLVAVGIKVMAQSFDDHNAISIAESLAQVIQHSTSSPFNGLLEINNPDYEIDMRFEDFFNRKTRKLGMLLNIKELQTFVHFPNSSIISPKLVRDVRRTKAIKGINEQDTFVLGINVHQGVEQLVRVNANQRIKHTHVIGATGTGKSSFLITQICQDITLGNGIAVIDPHGDLIDAVLQRIPKERFEDVIIIDPSDVEFPVGFNILSAHSDIEKDILSSDLVAVFRRFSTSWGDQMNSVFANAILAFLESNKGGTLVDLRRFLIEKSFRDDFLKSIPDASIVYYWQKEYPLLKSTSVGPILTRLDAFLRPKVIRNMVAQQKSLDFEEIINSKKILLIKLSQGLVGTENSYLLGSFFITKFHQAAMARQNHSKDDRQNFFIYIDEFQNFITPSMSAMLSGARKYHLGLILAHQDMQQLVKQDSELASSIISNAGIRVCFRLGDVDSKKFEDGFSYFEAKDLQNLKTGESICRIERTDADFNMINLPIPELLHEVTEELKVISRNKYGTSRTVIESEIKSSLHVKQTDFSDESIRHLNKDTPSITGDLDEVKEKFNKIDSIEQKLAAEETKKQLVEKQVETEHRYLQNLIKKMAQSKGYKAVIEDPLPEGGGMVDVTLERNGIKTACEISVTTKPSWEIHNIEKCFNAGFQIVVVCSTNIKILEKIKEIAEQQIDAQYKSRLLFMHPELLFQYFDEQIVNETTAEIRTKGYRVKVSYKSVTEEEMKRKKESVSKSIHGPQKNAED